MREPSQDPQEAQRLKLFARTTSELRAMLTPGSRQRRTKHPGSKRGAVHEDGRKSNAGRAVTRTRRAARYWKQS